MQIRTKLFAVIVLVTVTVIAAMLAVTRWSIERGFVEFVEGRQNERVASLAERLQNHHAEVGSWDTVHRDARRWLGLLYADSRRAERLRADRGHIEHSERRHRRRPGRRRLDRLASGLADGEWPPRTVIEHFAQEGRPLTLELRTMLLDQDGKPVRAREQMLDGATRHVLEIDGQRIGYLAVARGPSLAELGEIRFLKRQTLSVLAIAAGAIVLAGIVALWLAGRFTRPIAQVQNVTRQLAAGDYAARTTVRRNDEVGRLADDVDALGAALQSHEQARRQWVADIAHELRTPIAVMRAELEALQDGVRALDTQAVDALHDDIERLGRLVDDLHEVAQTDLGTMGFNMGTTALTELLEADVNAFQPAFDSAGLSLALCAPPLTIHGDGERLSQLVRNLLANSLRYTDSGGTVAISAARDGDYVSITVEDSAPGVPDEALGRLFDRLYRVDASRARSSGGSGLGLAICKNIAAAHGGSIDASASSKGGLAITVRLPVHGDTSDGS